MDILYHLLDSKWPFLASGVHHLDLQGATSSRSSMVSSAKTTPSSQTTCEVRFCSPEWLSQSWVGHTGALHVGNVFFFNNIYIYIYIMHHTLYPIRFDHGWFYPWWLSLVVKPPSMPRDQLFVVNSDLANFRLHAHCAAGTWNHKHLPVPTQSINLFIW